MFLIAAMLAASQARVTLNGKDYLSGKYGSPESREKYGRLIAEHNSLKQSGTFGKTSFLIEDVLLAYVEYAKVYYKAGSEYENLKLAVRPVLQLYGSLPANEFGPAQFRVVRDWWLQDESRSCQYINKQMKRLIRVVKWAVAQAMLPPETHLAIKCVDPLRKGRCSAREAKKILAVDLSRVNTTIAHMTPVLADMVRFQMLTGCRPGEIVRICPGMIERSGEVWEISLDEHKTSHRGKERTIYVGPQAQAVLSPYLDRAADAVCFSPQESERQRRLARSEARLTPISCGNRVGTNRAARSVSR